MSAIKGASAIEQHGTTLLAHGMTRDGGLAAPVRELVLQRMRQAAHPAWPFGSRVALRTDGQDRLSEERVTPPVTRAAGRRMTPAEKVAAARAAHPGASVRQLARITGLSKSEVGRLSQKVSQMGQLGTVSGTVDSSVAERG